METRESDGVGHVLIASAGAFEQDPLRPLAVSTMYAEKHASKSWNWTSPNSSIFGTFAAVCATGYGGRAYVAEAVTVFKHGHPQHACKPSNSSATQSDCYCFGVDEDPAYLNVCTTGRCCWEDWHCRDCSPVAPRRRLTVISAVHGLLTSTGVALQLYVLLREVPHLQHRYVVVSWLLQLIGSCCGIAPAVADTGGSWLMWHMILGLLALLFSMCFATWCLLKDDWRSVFAMQLSGASVTLGCVAAGLGCIAYELAGRLWIVGAVFAIFGITTLYAVVAAWRVTRVNQHCVEEPAQRIEITLSNSYVSRDEQVNAGSSSATPLHPQGH